MDVTFASWSNYLLSKEKKGAGINFAVCCNFVRPSIILFCHFIWNDTHHWNTITEHSFSFKDYNVFYLDSEGLSSIKNFLRREKFPSVFCQKIFYSILFYIFFNQLCVNDLWLFVCLFLFLFLCVPLFPNSYTICFA